MDDFVDTTSAAEPRIACVYRNLVVGRTRTDPWAVYRVHEGGQSDLSPGVTHEAQPVIELLGHGLDADFSLLRIARPWSIDQYALGVEAVADIRYVRRHVLQRYVGAQRAALEGLKAHTTSVYLSVRLPVAPEPPIDDMRRDGLLLDREARVFHRVLGCVQVSRASSRELLWLIRRAFRRGLPDTVVDEPVGTNRLAVSTLVDEAPLDFYALPPVDLPINVDGPSLRIESELGESHQSFLRAEVPVSQRRAPRAPLGGFFNLLQSLEFPVDAAIGARRLSDDRAIRVLRGDSGSVDRVHWLTVDDRPLLRVTVSLCVSASSAGELERRVVRARRELSGVRLHRPRERQLALFEDHFPAPTLAALGGSAAFTSAQVGGLGAASPSVVGSRAGFYIGHTISGTPRPVLFDPGEAAGSGIPTATLLTGGPGSGKTVCMELLMYHAFILGSVIYDVDPRGDHALERLPDVAGHVEVLELSAAKRFAGLLDPLQVGPDDAREQLAVDFLVGVLPQTAPPQWEREIVVAAHSVVARGGRSCGEVVDELARRSVHAQAAAAAIRRETSSGLAGLGFAQHDTVPVKVGGKQITSLRLRDMRPAAQDVADAEAVQAERIGRVIMRLLAAYVLKLAPTHQRRHCVIGLDQAAPLLADDRGRRLLDQLSHSSRPGGFTPVIAAETVTDAPWLDERFSTMFCFRPHDEQQARVISRLLPTDGDSRRLVRGLQSAGPGACVMRDYLGRVSPVQIDFVNDRLLPLLDTRPTGVI